VRTVRIAILGDSPCHLCTAACCKQNGHAYAALLRGDEVRRFAPFAIDVPIQGDAGVIFERVLPYRDGRCQFLGDDDRCTIYEDRPMSCRLFQCVEQFNSERIGEHGMFLKRNPVVLMMLKQL
jgi:Fe-S-cluster containining protein